MGIELDSKREMMEARMIYLRCEVSLNGIQRIVERRRRCPNGVRTKLVVEGDSSCAGMQAKEDLAETRPMSADGDPDDLRLLGVGQLNAKRAVDPSRLRKNVYTTSRRLGSCTVRVNYLLNCLWPEILKNTYLDNSTQQYEDLILRMDNIRPTNKIALGPYLGREDVHVKHVGLPTSIETPQAPAQTTLPLRLGLLSCFSPPNFSGWIRPKRMGWERSLITNWSHDGNSWWQTRQCPTVERWETCFRLVFSCS